MGIAARRSAASASAFVSWTVPGRVLGRRVDGVQPQVPETGVDDVVPDAGHDMDEATRHDGAALAVEDGVAAALDDDEDLVDVLVDLRPDVFARVAGS